MNRGSFRAPGADESASPAGSIPLEAIASPGCYVCQWSGHLLRVPADMLADPLRPLRLPAAGPLRVTKISDDPDTCVSRARVLAARCGLDPRF